MPQICGAKTIKRFPEQSGLIVRIASGRMIGGIQDLAHFRYLLPDRLLYSHFKRHARGLTTLTAAAQFQIDGIFLDINPSDNALRGFKNAIPQETHC